MSGREYDRLREGGEAAMQAAFETIEERLRLDEALEDRLGGELDRLRSAARKGGGK